MSHRGYSAIGLQKGPQTSSPWWRTRVTHCQSCKKLDLSHPSPRFTDRNESQRRKGSARSEGARTVKTSYNFLKRVHLSTLPGHSPPPERNAKRKIQIELVRDSEQRQGPNRVEGVEAILQPLGANKRRGAQLLCVGTCYPGPHPHPTPKSIGKLILLKN